MRGWAIGGATQGCPMQPDKTGAGHLQGVGNWVVMRGHAHGLRGPVLRGTLRWPSAPRWSTDALAAVLVKQGGLKPESAHSCLARGLDLPAFLSIVLALETAAQSPVTQTGMSLAATARTNEWDEHAVAFPTHRPLFTFSVVNWLVSAIHLVHLKLPAEQLRAAAKTVHAKLDEARSELRRLQAIGGINSARISRACGELGLPLQTLDRSVLHVGSGRNARIFCSTITEATPAVGVVLARLKTLTASILAAQGIPVPSQRVVASADGAVAAARELGYPVVVKPNDRDQGEGVHAGLTTDDQVRQCFGLAAAVSNDLLVETHIEGRDYRITVDGGKVVKAIGRRPGGVLGDGRSTVAQLVHAVSAAKPALRGSRSIVQLDREARDLLAERGMSEHSVPGDGQFVALRRRANMSTGGTSHDVLADLHPDNARLAIRAARALRLDVAGVDLIIPDIAVSWMDCKAAICEVNAQPQISTEFAPDVYRDMLARLVQAPVRLRTVLVLDASGGAQGDSLVIAAAMQLAQQGERVLSVRSDGRWLGDERIAMPAGDALSAAMGAELEPEATAAVAALTPRQVLSDGVPWLHIDQVRIAGVPASADVAELQGAMALVAPHVCGDLSIDADTARRVDPAVLSRFSVTLAGEEC